MPTDLFTSLGLFVLRGAVDPPICARLRAEMMQAANTPSTIVRRETLVDESHRRSLRAAVPSRSVHEITALLEALRPRVAEHFQRPLSGIEDPQFLVYEPGGFFGPHLDCGDAPPFMHARKISIVIFLEAAHRGGALVLYDLFPEATADLGLPFMAEEGTLLAFPSNIAHEVQTIEEGRRFTIVSWFTHGENDTER